MLDLCYFFSERIVVSHWLHNWYMICFWVNSWWHADSETSSCQISCQFCWLSRVATIMGISLKCCRIPTPSSLVEILFSTYELFLDLQRIFDIFSSRFSVVLISSTRADFLIFWSTSVAKIVFVPSNLLCSFWSAMYSLLSDVDWTHEMVQDHFIIPWDVLLRSLLPFIWRSCL